MSFKLPNLAYPYDALEPYIDSATMEIHHTKHHQGYVDKLNDALKDSPELLNLPIEGILKDISKVPDGIKQAVINNGGGHANHSFFWNVMKPNGGGLPTGELFDAIKATFGNFEEFKKQFTEKAMGVFGSGWAFLVMTPDKKLKLKRHSFQNSPYLQGNMPILGIDVWEHAYYLKYQNRRAEYIDAWWNVVNWEVVNALYLRSSKQERQ